MQPKYTWSRNDVGSHKPTSFIRTFQVGSMFCFLPASLISSTYTDKNSPFSRLDELNIPNLELFPNRVSIELSQIAFTTIVLPKDDRTDFAQEEQLGLPYWTMIWAICALVDVSKYLDILTLVVKKKRRCIFHSDLSISRYCICCLS